MITRRLLAGLGVAFAAKPAMACAEPRRSKVVYHVDELEKVGSALANIRNHYAGLGDEPERPLIALVVLGPALSAFRRADASFDVVDGIAALVGSGLTALACINTMRADKLSVQDLLPGFTVAERGGVVSLAQLQHDGYAYIKP